MAVSVGTASQMRFRRHCKRDMAAMSRCVVPFQIINQSKLTKEVQSVSLSPQTLNDFIINYDDGTSYFILPPAWGPSIAKEEQLLLELTARLQQQPVAMNGAARYSADVMDDTAVNTACEAAAAARREASAVAEAFAMQDSGFF